MEKYLYLSIFFICIIFSSNYSYADDTFLNNKDVIKFINDFNKKYKTSKDILEKYFQEAKFVDNSIELMDRQVEYLDWHTYKQKVLTPEKTKDGVTFYKKYRKTLRNAQKIYGVPAYIIAGIIGIETNYGKIDMRYRAFDTLATLAFYYPRRSEYFKKELEALIVYSREHKIDPFYFKSSFAGAVGIPQFMPSNIVKYAVDANKDGKIDIVNNMADAIYSVGNYLKKYGWKKDQPVSVKIRAMGKKYKNEIKVSPCSQKKSTVRGLKKAGIVFPLRFNNKFSASLFPVDIGDGKREYHVIFDNFCTIGKYNNSAKYILAVNYLGNRIGMNVGLIKR